VNTLNIGFTGTKRGMTLFQESWLYSTLDAYSAEPGERWFLHGDCVGADFNAADIAFRLGFKIWVFPPVNEKFRGKYYNVNRAEAPAKYLVRDHAIVDNCDFLIGMPGDNYEMRRSGTWASIRYAKKLDKPVWVCYPSHV
jgi:hypothetical protein